MIFLARQEDSIDLYWADFYGTDAGEEDACSELFNFLNCSTEILDFLGAADGLWDLGYRDIEYDTTIDGTLRIRMYRTIGEGCNADCNALA